jgi:AraC-like DNA-binding protein
MGAAATSSGKRHPVYVVLPDQQAWDWLAKESEQKICVKSIHRPFERKASLFLLCCDYKCRRENCLRKFFFALRNVNTRFGIIRPTLLSDRRSHLPEYFIEIFPRAVVSSGDELGENLKDFFFFKDHSSSASKYPILGIQKWIIENHGKVDSVARMKSELRISNQQYLSFFAETNLHLKTYIDKIRMCHALWTLISSGDAVKSVAYEFGLNPKSFSRKFHGVFGIWPSEAQAIIRSSLLSS